MKYINEKKAKVSIKNDNLISYFSIASKNIIHLFQGKKNELQNEEHKYIYI